MEVHHTPKSTHNNLVGLKQVMVEQDKHKLHQFNQSKQLRRFIKQVACFYTSPFPPPPSPLPNEIPLFHTPPLTPSH